MSDEVLGFRAWRTAWHGDRLVLTAYSADFEWSDATVASLQAPDAVEDLRPNFQGDGQTSSDVGFSACSTFDELAHHIVEDWWTSSIFGLVALGGTVHRSPFLRGQRARIIGLLDQLPCVTCHEDSEVWEDASSSVLCAGHGLLWSACPKHFDDEWSALTELNGAEDLQVMPTGELLTGFARQYGVPLRSLDQLQRGVVGR